MPLHNDKSPGDTIKSDEHNESLTGLSTGEFDTEGNSLKTFRNNLFTKAVISGAVFSRTGPNQLNRSAGKFYFNGELVSKSGETGITVNSNKDTYFIIDNAGNLSVQEKEVGALNDPISTSQIVMARIRTNASDITIIDQFGVTPQKEFIYPCMPFSSRQGNNYWKVLELGTVRKYFRRINCGVRNGIPPFAHFWLFDNEAMPYGLRFADVIFSFTPFSQNNSSKMSMVIEGSPAVANGNFDVVRATMGNVSNISINYNNVHVDVELTTNI